MQSRDPVHSPSQIEIALLRFLCDAQMDSAARLEVIRIFDSYRWTTPDNTIFFECIRDLFTRNVAILEHLPAALTRRGFPDMTCEFLAQPAGLNAASALTLAEKLLHSSKPAK